jgi:transcriptional regulator with XRE-family HTH domain
MPTTTPGELIQQARIRRGWSKQRLVDEIQAWEYTQGGGSHLGLDSNYVRKWERNERGVSDVYAHRIAAVLGIPRAQLVDGRSQRGRAKAGASASSSAVRTIESTASADLGVLATRDRLLRQWADLALLGPLGERLLAMILDPRRTLFMDRRTLLKLLGGATAAASLDALPRPTGTAVAPLTVEPTTASTLDALALRYQRMYHSTPPAELMVPVTAHIEVVDDLAKTAGRALQGQLLRNHSTVALLAGRLSFFDLQDPMAARSYYGMALDSAREAGDPHLPAATMGHMSFVAADRGRFTAALDLLDSADAKAAKSSILPSWLAAVEAEVRAKAGEPTEALRAADRAEHALGIGSEVPGWLDYYDATRLNGFKGFAYLTAGRPAEARAALQVAVASLDPGAVKQRAVFLADLATTYVREGEVDQACELAGQAAVALAQGGYATSAQRLREFRVLLAPWEDRPAVKDLDERLALV